MRSRIHDFQIEIDKVQQGSWSEATSRSMAPAEDCGKRSERKRGKSLRSWVGLALSLAAVLACILGIAQPVAAQNFPTVINTIAGGGPPNNVPATSTFLTLTSGNVGGRIGVDSSGNVFIADTGDSFIRKVDVNGMITTVAGNGTFASSGDGGPVTSAGLFAARSVVVDAAGDLFILDENVVRRVDHATQIITTVAGGGKSPGTCLGSTNSIGDGCAATSATLNFPQDVFVDAAGNLFIADQLNNRIRKVNAVTQIITTVAGNGTFGFSGDNGPATSAMLASPIGVAVDTAGNLFIADGNNNRVRKVDTTGVITTAAGGATTLCAGTTDANGDGCVATSATVFSPAGLSLDAAGNLFISSNGLIRRVDHATQIITRFAGGGTSPATCAGSTDSLGDGCAATSANIGTPDGVVIDAAGNLFIADTFGNRIRKVNTSGIISTFAGNGSFEGDGGPATSANLSSPVSAKLDTTGNLFVADRNHSVIREIFGPNPPTGQTTGDITTVAGGGNKVADGIPATSAFVSANYNFVDGAGNLFITDRFEQAIRRVDHATQMITRVAGGGKSPTTCAGSTNSIGDGCAATSASLNFPQGVFVDGAGNLFIADSFDSRIRKVDAVTQIITTVAGNGTSAFAGDGTPATSASLSFPFDIVVDAAGNLFISDAGNSRIRKVDTAGTITTVAGNGTTTFSGDGGPATSAGLVGLAGLALDSAGNLFVADSDGSTSNRIRRIDHATQFITTVAGSSTTGFSGDGGSATGASLNSPNDVAVDAGGNLFIVDQSNNRIREVITFPLANAQSGRTPVGTPLNLTLTGASPRGSVALTFAIVSQPSHGSLSNLSASAGTVTYTPAAGFSGADSFTFTVNDGNATSAATTISLSVLDFSIAAASGGSTSATVKAGQTASYSLALDLVGGSSTDQLSVTLSCAGAPAKATCTVPSGAVSVTGATPGTATITVSTTANTMLLPMRFSPPRMPGNRLPILVLCTLLVLVFWMFASMQAGMRDQRNGWVTRLAFIAPLLLLLVIAAATGCGGGSSSTPAPTPTPTNNGTPTGTSTLTVTATSGNITHTQQLTLTVQ